MALGNRVPCTCELLLQDACSNTLETAQKFRLHLQYVLWAEVFQAMHSDSNVLKRRDMKKFNQNDNMTEWEEGDFG